MTTREFGTEAYPIRVSSIPGFMKCTARSVLMLANLTSDAAGGAAHNGSSFHCLADAWHQSGFNRDYAYTVEAARRFEWPEAKTADVFRAFEGYIRDPRNRVELVASEVKIAFTLDPSQDDPTGSLIHFTGHIDQLRDARAPAVWDMKLSRLGGGDLINVYAYQIAMYAIGATKHFGREILPGGIIRCSTYATKEAAKLDSPGGVFFGSCLTEEVMESMVKDIAKQVAAVRRGDVTSRPGDHCSYCPVGHVSRCVTLINNLNRKS